MTTRVRIRAAKRIAASLATAGALAGTALLTAGPAHAGATCTVVQDDAPIYEHNSTQSRVVNRIDRGLEVNATNLPEDQLRRVSRVDNGAHLGYMERAHLDCSAG